MKANAKGMTVLLAVTVLAGGCATNRRWDGCAIGGGILGAAMGATAAGVYRYNSDDDKPSDATMAAVTGGGAAAGGLIGTLLGHYICDPIEEEPVAQPAPPPPPPPAGTEIAELRGTHFAFDSARLTPEGEAALDDAVRVMNEHPSISVSIEGHTDSVGSDAYNMSLGQRRADSVESHLVSQGISASRLSTTSYGESKPAASNDTAEGRAENRRVELIVQ